MVKETTTLLSGVEMPKLGFGTWHIDEGEAVEKAVTEALEVGYRLIDTASLYGNEAGVGRALAASGLQRKEYFVTTKVWNDAHGYDETLRAFDESINRLQLNYIDAYLIHWPVAEKGLFKESWRALERLFEENVVQSIGVSNFNQNHLEELSTSANIMPMINQIECHLTFQQEALRKYCQSMDIAVQAWRPLGKGLGFDDPSLIAIAEKYEKTPAQVALRYLLESGVSVIPKSIRRERMEENFALFDFALTEEERALLESFDKIDGRLSHDPDHFSDY